MEITGLRLSKLSKFRPKLQLMKKARRAGAHLHSSDPDAFTVM